MWYVHPVCACTVVSETNTGYGFGVAGWFLTRICTLFKGDNFSNRHKPGRKQAETCRRENCWQRISPATHCPWWGAPVPPPKNARILQCIAREVQETNIVLASNFFPEPLNYPKNTEACSRELSPGLSPPKSENQRLPFYPFDPKIRK